jgi:hypothetical protein
MEVVDDDSVAGNACEVEEKGPRLTVGAVMQEERYMGYVK